MRLKVGLRFAPSQPTGYRLSKGNHMNLWPKRKSDQEYIEQVRRNIARKWLFLFARVFLLTVGLVYCGLFIWFVTMLWRSRPSFVMGMAIGDPYGSLTVAFIFGALAGMMLLLAIWSFHHGIFLHFGDRNIRLMLKYHDALVAHGISPNEQSGTEQ